MTSRLRRISRGIALGGHRLLIGDLAEALRFRVARGLGALERTAGEWRDDWVYELSEIATETDERRYAHARALVEWLDHPKRLGRSRDLGLLHHSSLLDFIARGQETDEAAQGNVEALGARNAILEAENRRLRAALALADELGRLSEA